MIRTFIAVEIPGQITRKLDRELASVKETHPLVKWSKTENIHLTLRFLGDVPENDLDELFSALADAVDPLEPFTLDIRGTGAFPNWRHPRVVWAGCGEGAGEAIGLAEAVEETCRSLGYPPERRAFRPHLTLARVKEPAHADNLETALAGFADTNFGMMEVSEIAVYMSTLRRSGPVYAPMAHFSLNG